MKNELRFISTLIATAERRVAQQTTLVGRLAGGSTNREMEAARAALRQMNARLDKLYRGRAKLEDLHVRQATSVLVRRSRKFAPSPL